MKDTAFETLQKKHSVLRLMLLITLMLYVAALFALISRWPNAVLFIAAALLFHIAGMGTVRRQYRAEYIRACALSSVEDHLDDASYEKSRTISSDLLTEKGFVPDVAFVPNAQLHHVISGVVDGHPAMIAEMALVRMGGSRRTVAGTLLTVEGAAPADESWTMLWNGCFDGVAEKAEYQKEGWQETALPPSVSKLDVVCLSRGESTLSLRPAANVLQPYNRDLPFAAAVHNGQVSLLLLNTFYARKPSDTKTPRKEEITGGAIAGMEVVEKLVKAMKENELNHK